MIRRKRTRFTTLDLRPFKKIVPIHLITGDDPLRGALSYIEVTKEYISATDSRALVRHQTKNIFNEAFIEQFPLEKFYIHRELWKLLVSPTTLTFRWNSDPSQKLGIIVTPKKRPYEMLIHVCQETEDGRFPNVEAVIPDKSDRTSSFVTILNPTILSNLTKAMVPANDYPYASFRLHPTNSLGSPYSKGVNPNRPIIVSTSMDEEVTALIMPILL